MGDLFRDHLDQWETRIAPIEVKQRDFGHHVTPQSTKGSPQEAPKAVLLCLDMICTIYDL